MGGRHDDSIRRGSCLGYGPIVRAGTALTKIYAICGLGPCEDHSTKKKTLQNSITARSTTKRILGRPTAFLLRGYTREAAIRPNKHHRTGNDRPIACSYSPENICQSQIPIGRQGSPSHAASRNEGRAMGRSVIGCA
jgi:hypothetical protein